MLKAVFQCGTTKAEAMQIEKFVKKQKSRNLLEQLCDPSFIPTEYLAQLVRVRTCGINQRVVRTCGTAGAEGWQFAGLFMFYLYIIYSASANKYYVGHSVDPGKDLLSIIPRLLQAILRNTVPGC
jgi:predicted GIY-YIG superfamily endonuclease